MFDIGIVVVGSPISEVPCHFIVVGVDFSAKGDWVQRAVGDGVAFEDFDAVDKHLGG